jgi:hypothetical protein
VSKKPLGEKMPFFSVFVIGPKDFTISDVLTTAVANVGMSFRTSLEDGLIRLKSLFKIGID